MRVASVFINPDKRGSLYIKGFHRDHQKVINIRITSYFDKKTEKLTDQKMWSQIIVIK